VESDGDCGHVGAFNQSFHRDATLPLTRSYSTLAMPPLRRKRSPARNKGLQPGESLKRYLVPANRSQSSLWAWVGSEVSKEADITTEHCLMACGLSSRNHFPMCVSKCHASDHRQTSAVQREHKPSQDDVIIISDDEGNSCTKKNCKDNPNCLNYLGQDKWEDEGMPRLPC
jgi:ubiquitin carboxyl-terminal hydrolase 48